MEIVAYELPRFEYRQPVVSGTADGELEVTFDTDALYSTSVGASIFLFEITRCKTSNVITKFIGLDQVNAYLMHRSLNDGLKDTRPIAKALLCYFQFLYDHDLNWRVFPVRNHLKPTYRFKRYVEELYREGKLALTTAKAYMAQVVRFYKFYLKRRDFDNAPFEYEEVSIDVAASPTGISESRRVTVITTDLRLKFAQQRMPYPTKLRSLTEEEWEVLDRVLREDRCGIQMKQSESVMVKLAQEFSLIFLLMRYTGLRREEALSLPARLIEPDGQSTGYAYLHVSPGVGVKTKRSKARDVECPRNLVRILHDYKCSERFRLRSAKYVANYPEAQSVPLFLSREGHPFGVDSLNARWGEVRRYIRNHYQLQFLHKPHNLRATYGTFRLKELISGERCLSVAQAQVHLQTCMGHKDLSTTEHYLTQLKNSACAFALVEHAIDFQLEDI